MFCGSAAGEMLPPMVVYKALNLYTSWCERGPKGAIFACSKSGWFGMFEFERWFVDLLLPRLKRKVIINNVNNKNKTKVAIKV